MMTTTPELDRALHAASDAIHGQGWSPRSHIYAQALVAELLRGIEPPEWFTTDEDCGFNAALAEIKRRAGLEGEG